MLVIAIVLKNCSCKSGKTDTFDLALICYTPQETYHFTSEILARIMMMVMAMVMTMTMMMTTTMMLSLMLTPRISSGRDGLVHK